MRFAHGFLASALVLFLGGALGRIGSWAVPVAAITLLVAAVSAAIAMDDRPGHRDPLAERRLFERV